MRRVSFLMIAFLMTIGVAMAQSPEQGRRNMDSKAHSEKRTEQMVKEYGLNESQKAKLQEINTSMSEQMKGNRQEMTKEMRDQMRAEMKKNQDAYDSAVKEIFTAEQYQKFQENQAERQKKMKENKKMKKSKGE